MAKLDINVPPTTQISFLPRLQLLLVRKLFQAVGMASGAKGYEEDLAGCRVKLLWPNGESFCEGVVSSHGQSGKNLVVFSIGVEEILKLKKDHRESVKDVFPDQGTRTCNTAHASSHMLSETNGIKDNGAELVGCRVKVWRPKSKTLSEGVVASYDRAQKKHLVVYTDGIQEMLNLRTHREPASDVYPDQAQKARVHARDSSSMSSDDDMDAHSHLGKKHKGHIDDHTPATPMFSMDKRVPKLEKSISPIKSTLSTITSDEGLVNINGYKIKTALAPILDCIFAKYGDIAANCLYKSASVRASLLEVVCNVVLTLQYNDVDAILSDLEVLENEVSDVEASKIKVSWLREHIAKIHKIAAFKDNSVELKKTKAKSSLVTKAAAKEMKQRQVELLIAQERFKEAEKRVNALRIVSQKIDDDILESESEEYFWKRRLDDLL